MLLTVRCCSRREGDEGRHASGGEGHQSAGEGRPASGGEGATADASAEGSESAADASHPEDTNGADHKGETAAGDGGGVLGLRYSTSFGGVVRELQLNLCRFSLGISGRENAGPKMQNGNDNMCRSVVSITEVLVFLCCFFL